MDNCEKCFDSQEVSRLYAHMIGQNICPHCFSTMTTVKNSYGEDVYVCAVCRGRFAYMKDKDKKILPFEKES